MKPLSCLTPAQRMALCRSRAEHLVALYRAQAPAGFDPKLTWVAVGVAVVGATVSAVQAHKQAQAQKAAADTQAKNAANNQLPEFKPPPVPAYVPFDFQGTQKGAIEEDRLAYKRSDDDFARRHAPTLSAEKLFEQSVLDDQKGDKTLMPAIQNEFMRAGIGGALGSFGDTGANLTPGGAGEAAVGRNLGMSIEGFQDRNRANRQQSLATAESIFPRREFGMNGSDFALTALQDAVNQNAQNTAKYQAETGAYQANYQINATNQNAATQSQNALVQANAEADAAQSAAYAGAATQAIGAGAKAYGAYSGGSAPPSNLQTYQPASNSYRPGYAKYPGSNTWTPTGTYA